MPLSDLILWLIERYWLNEPAPAQVQSAVLWLVTLLVAGGAAWLSPHTARPDLETQTEGSLAEVLMAAAPPAPVVNVYQSGPAVHEPPDDPETPQSWEQMTYDGRPPTE